MARRSIRDWFVDITMFLLAASLWLLASDARLHGTAGMPQPAWLFDVDQLVGVLASVTVWIRKKWPVQIALVLVALSAFAELSAGWMLIALFTVAVHRPPRTTTAVFALSLVAAVVFVVVRPDPELPGLMAFLLAVTLQGAAVGWGLFIHHRRQLVSSLEDRAARAEAEAQLRAHLVREEIAREMHDVLGHRLSLLSVYAGALEYNPGSPPADVARAAKIIRTSAHQALQDLREVIGVLRAPVGELPQPTLGDVEQLVAESRRAGMRVQLRHDVRGTVPDLLGRNGYRIVQEAMTNARKHAPGADVEVALTGSPGEGLTVEVGNTATGRPADADTQPGKGLVGLSERVALAEGRLEHGPTSAGWRVAAWLPWPS
ncbi:MAG: histidine kinase [Kibdelosporangium sp.]